MARVKLALPDDFVFRAEITLRIGDINYGGHLGNDAVLSLLHDARVQFLKANGFSELDVGGCGIIMSDAVIVYGSEAFHGETMVIDVAVADFARVGCDIMYRIQDKETEREVARAKTGIVFFDYDKRKTVAIPDEFKSKFGAH